MADLLRMSADIIDNGADHGPINRINHQLSELDDRLAIVEAFSHSVLFDTGEGLVVFDTSGVDGGQRVVEAIRGWRKQTPFRHLIYTHGHVDHVGGSGAFIADAKAQGETRPQVIAHAQVPERFARYRLTKGYNSLINARQFQSFARRGYHIGGDQFLPETVADPDTTYQESLGIASGDRHFYLYHAKGETDDHTWAYIPEYKAICAGDFFIWNFPNAGNPQKVQRYPVEWAQALRTMASKDVELFIPAHGLPISGQERIRALLTEVASTLEKLIAQTLEMMNQGASRNDIIHTVKVDAALLAKPWLKPLYDEPEFVVNNLWRQFGGWYDGNPAHLKPATSQSLAAEIVTLVGGVEKLIERALACTEAEDHRLACHLIEFAVQAKPSHQAAHRARAVIYQARRDQETSLMAKGIFGYTVGESKAEAGDPDEHKRSDT